MASAPFCGDCPDREACSSGLPCEVVRDIQGIDDGLRKAPLIHEGRQVGVAEVNPDDNTVVCRFDVKNLKVREVIELFWVGIGDKFELNILTTVQNTKE